MHFPRPHRALALRLASAGLIAAFSVTGTAPAGAGDDAPRGIVEKEIARRNNLTRQAAEAMQRGNQARKQRDLAAALAAYREVYEQLPESPVNATLRAQGLLAFSETSVARAEELAMLARYDEANATLDVVLQPGWNPDFPPALRLKQQIQDPERYNPAATPRGIGEAQEVTKLLTLGNGHFALGEFDRARDSYNRALAIDRYNSAARRGLEKTERTISEHLLSARDHTRAHALRQVDEQWETPVTSAFAFDAGAAAGPDLGGEAGGGAGIREKLRSIILPTVQLVDVSMNEAVEFLVFQSRNHDTTESDPARKGINIVLGNDPALPAKRITLSLTDVPLQYALDAVARAAGTDVQVDDFLVTFGPAGTVPMVTRSFRVPPGFFTSAPAPEGVGEADDPFATQSADENAPTLAFARIDPKALLGQSGVTFPDGSSVYYSPATGVLTVRNTGRNLDLVQTLVDQAGSSVQKLIRLQVTMLEVYQEDLHEMGFDWLLGAFNVGGDRVFGSGGTSGNQPADDRSLAQNFPLAPPGVGQLPVGQNPVTAGNRSGNSATPEQTLDALLRTGIRNPNTAVKAPAVFGVSGVLTDPQFQVVMRALNQKKGIDLASSPSVLAKSGQRAKVQIIREFPYPTEFEPPEIPQDFGGFNGTIVIPAGVNIQQNNAQIPITPTTPTAFEVENLGHALEVEATVGPDNRTIDIDVAPAFGEFEGFINYGSPVLSYPNGLTPVVLTENRILQPVFRINKTDGGLKVTLWSGSAMVIAGLATDEQTTVEDKTPILGDVPYFGRFFRSKASKSRQKALVFLLKAEVVDPSGEVPPIGSTVAAQN